MEIHYFLKCRKTPVYVSRYQGTPDAGIHRSDYAM